MTKITAMRVVDVRLPTSQHLDGSDAMNPDPDYSAAYVDLETDQPGLEGHGLTFTIGRGNQICCAAIEAMRHLVVGLDMAWVAEDMGRFWRHITSDSQLRWIGADKGAIHLATGAVVNAVWDLWAKQEGVPVSELVSRMSPEEIVKLIDFRYITDCITPDEALALLKERAVGKDERRARLQREGYPCYTTSAGWLGYDDDKLRRLAQEAVDAGFNHIKLKVGRVKADDIRLLRIAREPIPGTQRPKGHREQLTAWRSYWVDCRWVVGDAAAKLAGAYARLLGRGDDGAVLVLWTDNPSQDEARALLEKFVRENLSAIETLLAQTRDQR